jgi:hypothetical protein
MKKPLKSEDFVSKINSLVNTSVGVLSTKKTVFHLAYVSDLQF